MSEEERRKLHESDEASAEGLRLAHEAGKAYERMVRYFIENIAHAGRTAECADYRVGIAVEKAEPLWYHCGDELALREPPKGDNQHLEVIVTDRADGRFLPALDVNVELVAEDGSSVGTWQLPFLWHPTMFHYGLNVAIPRSGRYTAKVSIARPTFARHDKTNGRRYVESVVVRFDDLALETAREAG